jgi:hypothetical protein
VERTSEVVVGPGGAGFSVAKINALTDRRERLLKLRSSLQVRVSSCIVAPFVYPNWTGQEYGVTGKLESRHRLERSGSTFGVTVYQRLTSHSKPEEIC